MFETKMFVKGFSQAVLVVVHAGKYRSQLERSMNEQRLVGRASSRHGPFLMNHDLLVLLRTCALQFVVIEGASPQVVSVDFPAYRLQVSRNASPPFIERDSTAFCDS